MAKATLTEVAFAIARQIKVCGDLPGTLAAYLGDVPT